MSIEVVIWLIANTISLIVSGKDLEITYRVWSWTRRNASSEGLLKLTKRNFRASAFKFSLAASFILAGITAVVIESLTPVWFLIAGSVILTLDVIWESKYRSYLFRSAQEKSKHSNKQGTDDSTEGESPLH